VDKTVNTARAVTTAQRGKAAWGKRRRYGEHGADGKAKRKKTVANARAVMTAEKGQSHVGKRKKTAKTAQAANAPRREKAQRRRRKDGTVKTAEGHGRPAIRR
jgi:hypothetical protein